MSSVTNCLITTVDCLRYDAIGDLPAEDSTLEERGLRDALDTPNMNRLVESGTAIPNLHAPYGSTPSSTSSLLTGLYPREHGVYDYFRPLKKTVMTLADYFSKAGYYTLIGDGHFFFDKMGVLASFDEHLKGPASSLIERIKELNEAGENVFAYYHTMDVHPPYLVACNPPGPEYNDRAIELGNELADRLGQSKRFDRGDIHIQIEGDKHRDLVSSEQCPLWEFLNDYVLYHYRRDEQVFEDPVQRLAELYVEGVNRFDRHQFKPVVDFLLDDDAGGDTVFLLTSDHGQYPRTINDEPTFYHRGKPEEELITVPGILCHGKQEIDAVGDHSLTSLVDVAPTLLNACNVSVDESIFSGINLLEESDDRDYIFAEHSETIHSGGDGSPPEESDFPLPALLKWSALMTDDGYKFYTDRLLVSREDLNLDTKTFIRTVFEKVRYQWLPIETRDTLAEDLDSRDISRGEFVQGMMEENPIEQQLELYSWEQDIHENKNLIDGLKDQLPIDRWLKHLSRRFPSNSSVTAEETVEHSEATATNDSEETTSKLEGFGYL